MKVNLNDATVSIKLGEAGMIDVDVAKIAESDAVVNYVFQYGLRQMLNDVHAGVTKKVEPDDAKRAAAKWSLASKKLDSLLKGEVAQERIGGGDPVAREMFAMAEKTLKGKLAALGKKVSDYDKKLWRSVVEKQVAANEAEYREAAERKLAIKAEVKPADAEDILAMLEG